MLHENALLDVLPNAKDDVTYDVTECESVKTSALFSNNLLLDTLLHISFKKYFL